MKSLKDKYKGLSFAEAAKRIAKKYPRKDIDLIQNTSFKHEMALLERLQEEKKAERSPTNSFQDGGIIPPSTAIKIGDILKSIASKGFLTPGIETGTAGVQDATDIPPTLPVKTIGVSMNPTAKELQERLSGGEDLINRNNKSLTDRKGINSFLPAALGTALSTVINAAILAGGPDKFEPRTNPREAESLRLLRENRIDTTALTNRVLGAINAGRENLKNVRSANVRNALDANLVNQAGQSLMETKFKENVQNNAYRTQLANALAAFGAQAAQAQSRADILNAQSKATFQTNLSALGAFLGDTGRDITNILVTQRGQTLLADILDKRYSKFGISKDVVNRYLSGAATDEDIIRLKSIPEVAKILGINEE